jgi:hypothetical protein
MRSLSAEVITSILLLKFYKYTVVVVVGTCFVSDYSVAFYAVSDFCVNYFFNDLRSSGTQMKYCYLKLFSFIISVGVLEELLKEKEPIPVVLRSKAKVCGRSIAGVAGSNRAAGMGVRLLCLLWVV